MVENGATHANDTTAENLDLRSRWSIYWLLIACSLAVVCARLWQVETVSYGRDVPFLSANDRSRWCTIRALGDHDTYAIDEVLQSEGGESWDTIDKVMHWGRDFRPHFYSSKPTFLPTVLTYPYLALKGLTDWTLQTQPFAVVRWMLALCQVLPLVLFFWSVGRIGDLVARTEWARVFLMVLAGFGTFVTTFAITLNNHVPAAIAAAVAMYSIILIHTGRGQETRWYFVAGLASAFAAASDIPALALVLVCLAICVRHSFARTLVGFLPPALVIAASFFATNWKAHQDWRPPYAHRSDGPVLDVVEGQFGDQLANGTLPDELRNAIIDVRQNLAPSALAAVTVRPGQWPLDDDSGQRWIVYFDEKSEPAVLYQRPQGGCEIRQWDNWYEYPGSYWLQDNAKKSAVDRGEAAPWEYVFHLTLGHHGAFSLTPVWLLSLAGIFPLCFSRRYGLQMVGLGILAVSVVVFAFYVMRPIDDRNYGGQTCGPRWLFWLIPLWLVAMIPVLDAISKNVYLRWLATILLIFSIASAFYAWTNPWVHPWIYELTGPHWFGLP